jgi:hypothetical protein
VASGFFEHCGDLRAHCVPIYLYQDCAAESCGSALYHSLAYRLVEVHRCHCGPLFAAARLNPIQLIGGDTNDMQWVASNALVKAIAFWPRLHGSPGQSVSVQRGIEFC